MVAVDGIRINPGSMPGESHGFVVIYGMESGKDGSPWPSAAFSALGRWEVLEPLMAGGAVDSCFLIFSKPQAAATFANFQLYAQIHDSYSVSGIWPAAESAPSAGRRAGGTSSRRAGVLCPAGGWRLASRYGWSCSSRRNPGNSNTAPHRSQWLRWVQEGSPWGGLRNALGWTYGP